MLDFHVAGAGVGARDGERQQIRLAGGEAGVAGARVAIDRELPGVEFETGILLGRIVGQRPGHQCREERGLGSSLGRLTPSGPAA